MLYQMDSNSAPCFPIEPDKGIARDGISPPKCALPLVSPLTQRQSGNLIPKPYRIMTNIKSISACVHRNAAIDNDGGLWIWGAVSMAKTTEGYFTNDMPQDVQYVPQYIMGDVISFSAGAWHTLCVTKDGKLWGWGSNQTGALGLGDDEDRSTPTYIMNNVKKAFAFNGCSFIIKEDDSLWGFGYDDSGICFDTSEIFNTPIFLLDDVATVSCGEMTVAAVKKNGELWGWGLHDNPFTRKPYGRYAPSLYMTGVRELSFSVSNGACCLITTQSNDLYSIGNGYASLVPYSFRKKSGTNPVKVMEGVASAYAGREFSLVRLLDGRLYSYGDNGLGQCGIGKSTRAIGKPRHIMSNTVDAATGHFHGMALQANGDLWIWGGDYGISENSN